MLDIQAEQHDLGQAYLDLYEAVGDLKRRHDLHPCSVRPRDGLALRRDSEREVVQDLIKRFRNLPGAEQRRLPALLNSLAQLEIVVGDLEAGQQDFEEVARLVADPISQAEANHNVYRAALERRDFHDALAALRRAVELDVDAFEPFPFARYDPLRILGSDGFSTSFLCQMRSPKKGSDPVNAGEQTPFSGSGERLIVKALRPENLDRDVATIARELGWVRELDHPVLVRLHDVINAGDGSRPSIVAEFFEADTLTEYIARHGPLAPDDWFDLAWPIARALQALHGRGVLHRTLNPDTVLVCKEKKEDGSSRWRVKLVDATLSLKRSVIHAYASHAAARTQTALGRSVARNVPFAAPEVVARPKGQVWVGPHSDVFSFGRLSLFALTGKAEPDAGDRVILNEFWRQLIDDCSFWVQSGRPAHIGLVLDRLSALPGANERIERAERAVHEDAIARNTAILDRAPDDADALLNRANAYFRQNELPKAVADFTRVLELRPDGATFRRRGLARMRLGAPDDAIADFTEALRLEPRDAEALGNRGLAYAQQGEQDKAIADYTEALRINPRDEAMLFNRASAYFVQCDYERAIAAYTEVIRLNPRHAWAVANRGKVLALRGDATRAIADFTRFLQLEPDNLRALWDRALAHANLGQFDKALADFGAAIHIDPYAGLFLDRGLTHARRGNLEDAIADFTEAIERDAENFGAYQSRGNANFDLGRLDAALTDLDAAVRLAPEAAAPCYNRGNVHARKGNHDLAVADYTKALELNPDYHAAQFNRANVHAERGALDDAIADYSALLSKDARDTAALTNRGNTYTQMGELDLALADYNASLALEPNDALTLLNRATLHLRRDEPEQALGDYDAGLRLDPQNARGFNARGNLHAERGDYQRALPDYTESIKLDAAFARAWFNRANVHAALGEPLKVIADLTESIRLDPNYAAAFYNRGNAHLERGADVEAVADYTEAIRLDARHAGAFNNRGNARVRLGELEQAVADFTAAIELDPKFGMPWFNRANARSRLGDDAAALADLDEAIRLSPDDLAALHNRGRIRTRRGDHAGALADNLEALRLRPDDARTCNNLAWLWATTPREELRDAAQAVEKARKACELTNWQEPGYLDTLAVAYAAAGRFEEALHWQRRAMELCRVEERADYESRLRLYEAGQAYREEGS